LVHLIRTGWLDGLCQDFTIFPDSVLKALMHLFATLFVPRYLPITTTDSSVILEPLPEEIQFALRSYNTHLVQYLSLYASTKKVQEENDAQDQDLAHITAVQSIGSRHETVKVPTQVPDLVPNIENNPSAFSQGALVLAAPHFHALTSETAADKIPSVSSDRHQEAILPNALGFPFYTIPPRVVRNNYILAYYLHCDTTRIAMENKVSERDLWQDLYDMAAILKQSVAFLTSCSPPIVKANTQSAVKDLAVLFDKKFKRMWA
jgi:hypothetical protein